MELIAAKRAPQVWEELDATGRAIFHAHVEKDYPLFKLAEGGWKLDRMACDSYSAWRKYYLDGQGNLIPKSKRCKRKRKNEESKPTIYAKKQLIESKETVYCSSLTNIHLQRI